MRIRTLTAVAGIAAGAAALVALAANAQTPLSITYAPAQADAGQRLYAAACAACHGAQLEGAGPSIALKGASFTTLYAGRPLSDLMRGIKAMPPGSEPTRSDPDNAALLAYLLRENNLGAPGAGITAAEAQLARLTFPGGAQAQGGGRGGRGGAAPAGPTLTFRGSPLLDRMTPVTDANLQNPSPADWINWRRTRDGYGFSPLTQINRANAPRLKTAWSWALPRGENMMTPLIHDGVLYAYSFGDVVEALDAATGELLWRHSRPRTTPGNFQGKKGLAIHGHTLFVPTSDSHVLALDARTGKTVWDTKLDIGTETDFQIKSAPIVAKGKVILGMNGFAAVEGGNFIVALDIATGKEAWRFWTIARPGEPGGNTWNGLPLERRSGGSVWVSGSYDDETGLVYFGAAPTYATEPLRDVRQPGVTNDALYTNATLALDPATGKLVWYYQHANNDQLDHDWVFERQIIDVMHKGQRRKAVVNAGKWAIYDVLDARTGEFLFAMDLGFQNVVASIDPVTGKKILNPAAIPTPTQQVSRFMIPGICPDPLGARNLMAASYNPTSKLILLPLTDTCVHPFPRGTRWQKNPDPRTDGQYGVIQAIDLQNRKVVWTRREKAPPVSGALNTAGGLLFVGDADRWFRAYDDRTGRELWKVRLDNAPASYPVTYEAGGKQYVAVATNVGSFHVRSMNQVANIANNTNDGATLWVFAVE